MIEFAIMVLRQSMRVAVHETTLAFDSQQPRLLIATEAAFLVLLLPSYRLQAQFVHRLQQLPLRHALGGIGLSGGLRHNEILFGGGVPEWGRRYL
jgi:hypothetical protein